MTTGTRVEIRSGEHGPVVVKIALDPPARERLAHEATRLDQARHPGVVELLEAGAEQLVLAWAGDQTLELTRPGVEATAAIVAAVASTVADLHGLGIVHGRIRPQHVIIGADGRPRLCSLGGPAPGEAAATPAGDVADVGRLIDHLLGDGLELEPIPDRRWARRRSPGPDRRSLLAVADRAGQDDPAQRPTARSLALLVTDAVPGARLPRPAAPPPAPAPAPAAWAAPVEPDLVEPQEAEEPQEPHEGDGPDGPEEPPRRGEDPAPAPTWEGADGTVHPATVGVPAPGVAPAWLIDHPLPDAERFLGLRVDPDEVPRTLGPDGTRDRPRPRGPGWPAPAGGRRRAGRSAGVVAVVAIAALGLAVVGGWLRGGAPTPEPTAAVPPPARSVSPATADSPAVTSTSAPAPSSVPGCPNPTGPAIDLDGDRCPDRYRIEGTTIRTGGQTWSIGQAGDQVALGDWDCDGRATPGVVRPTTGEVFLFSRWPIGAEGLTVEPSAVRAGATRLAAATPGAPCTAPSVRLRDGRQVAVPVEQAPR